ncbi:hypothetical protein P152DRAFT_487845 [Eremomyces bilateralis CBS 781.70]|uniref:MYND-type domain-containing protein n=1 Tax=Eremomyces bilateralis CBS 781.70 TaxID=1392243 RepID=A0A6G1G303_9PEZI|nr:uncharacterized protein P152DRAFT_487845 [Eremomyces bilateralis CBS 781.70]KAF1812296.1 hypothetical protein P152DRAFT_487845 [Eremomyces bilateralis CBS 781.70]
MQSAIVLRRFPCANQSASASCQNEGKSACSACRMVLYCNQSCQRSHWSDHKKDCKSPMMKPTWTPSWHIENRTPTFINNNAQPYTSFGGGKYLWGNVPAIDVLALKNNEGLEYGKDLSLLFAASGDIRNVLKTIASLPTTYNMQLAITLNDHELDIVARNAIMLILLLAVEEPETAVDCVVHTWYSAQISKTHLDLLDTTVRPLLQDMCTKIVEKPDGKLLAKTWHFGKRGIRIALTKQAWIATLSYLDMPAELTSERAHKVRTAVTLAPERKDHLERHLFAQAPARRVGFMKFRQDGILLPFGHSRHAYNIPNPTFFQSSNTWLLKDAADPTAGWSHKDVWNTSIGSVYNDVYGKLYFHVKDVLTSVHKRLRSLEVVFHLFQLDARELTDHLKVDTLARIEVSNICDGPYLGPAPTVCIFAPFLQKRTTNPHASLITLFMNAVEEEYHHCGDQYNVQVMQRELQRIMKYMPYRPGMHRHDPALLQALSAKSLVRDGGRYLEKFMKRSKFDLIEQLAKAKVKKRNSIIGQWPARLKLRPGHPGAQDEFDSLVSSTLNGTECYLEWHRVD